MNSFLVTSLIASMASISSKYYILICSILFSVPCTQASFQLWDQGFKKREPGIFIEKWELNICVPPSYET